MSVDRLGKFLLFSLHPKLIAFTLFAHCTIMYRMWCNTKIFIRNVCYSYQQIIKKRKMLEFELRYLSYWGDSRVQRVNGISHSWNRTRGNLFTLIDDFPEFTPGSVSARRSRFATLCRRCSRFSLTVADVPLVYCLLSCLSTQHPRSFSSWLETDDILPLPAARNCKSRNERNLGNAPPRRYLSPRSW